jgi:proteasome lid subunit RPN8/RPN11
MCVYPIRAAGILLRHEVDSKASIMHRLARTTNAQAAIGVHYMISPESSRTLGTAGEDPIHGALSLAVVWH